MKISIIIPVYNSEVFLPQLFESILLQKLKQTEEILFIDNNSIDNSINMIEKFIAENPNLNISLLFYKQKQSSYGARNMGVEKALGEYICFIDSDCILTKEYLENTYKFINQHPDVIISGNVELYISNKRNIWENFDKEVNMRNDKKIKANSAATANLITPKTYFEQFGNFQEITSGGDIEWTQRVVRLGKNIVYAPEVKVLHPCRKTWAESKKKMHRLGIGFGEKASNKMKIIILYFIRIFYITTNIRISKAIIKNVGWIGIIRFNFYFFALRFIQLQGVIQGVSNQKYLKK